MIDFLKKLAHDFMAYRLYILPITFCMILMEFPVPQDIGMIVISLAFALCMTGGYLINKYTDSQEDAVNVGGLPVAKNKKLFWIAVACITLPFFATLPNTGLMAVYVGPVMLGLWYSFKIQVGGGKRIRLKELLFFKNMTSAFIWATFPSLVPTFYMGWPIDDSVINTFVIYFCIILALEITWDIRDIKGDLENGIKTIANTWGAGAARGISALLVLSVFIRNYAFLEQNPAFMTATIAHMVLTLMARPDSKPLFYQCFAFIWLTAFLFYVIEH